VLELRGGHFERSTEIWSTERLLRRDEKFIDDPGLLLQIDRIMSASKDTKKAIVIILFYLALLCGLLLFANHIRPHP
jgi:hypothetical protein